MKKIKVKLSSYQWSLLSDLLQSVAEVSPVENYELSSLVLADTYHRRIATWSFFRQNFDKRQCFSFSLTEIQAIHDFFHKNSILYNLHLRAIFEPKLITGNLWSELSM